MRTVTVSTQLPAPAEAVWSAATRNSDAFRYITRGLIRFPAARAWDRPLAVGDRLHGWLFLFGVVPLSRHTITVAEIDQDQRGSSPTSAAASSAVGATPSPPTRSTPAPAATGTRSTLTPDRSLSPWLPAHTSSIECGSAVGTSSPASSASPWKLERLETIEPQLPGRARPPAAHGTRLDANQDGVRARGATVRSGHLGAVEHLRIPR